MTYVGHMDLASLSVAHERDPDDLEVLGLYHEALCRVLGCLPYMGSSVGKITEDGEAYSHCRFRGCAICVRCRQVTCEHAHLFTLQPSHPVRQYTYPGRGSKVVKVCPCGEVVDGIGYAHESGQVWCSWDCELAREVSNES